MRGLTLVLLALPLPASADEVLLRGGGRVVGVVVEESAERIVLETGPGRVALRKANVASVKRTSSDLGEWSERARRLAATDVDGWLTLGLWAQERGLETQARAAFQRVLALDPDNAAAHAGLGHVQDGGRYVTIEESRRSRGDVLYQGEWMSRDERADRQREEAEERAAFRARIESEARAREAEARAREAEAAAERASAAASPGIGGQPWFSPPLCYGPMYGASCVSGPVYLPGGRRHGLHPSTPVAPPPPSRPVSRPPVALKPPTSSWR